MSHIWEKVVPPYRKYCDAFQNIADQGENVDRNEALEIIEELLNAKDVASQNQTFGMVQALSRAVLAGEIDDDAADEWEDTAEYLAATTAEEQDIKRYALVTEYLRNRSDLDPDKYSHDEDWGAE